MVSILGLYSAAAAPGPAVGYGSSNAVAPSRFQEMFLMGFDAGFNRDGSAKSRGEFLVEQSSDGSQLGAMTSARRLVAAGVSALAGYPSSHEALLAGQVAQRGRTLMISAGASHSGLAGLGDTVYTIGEASSETAKTVLDLVEERYKGKPGLLIANPYAAFSVDQEANMRREIERRKIKNVTVLHLNQQLVLSDADLKAVKRAPNAFMLITVYADEVPRFLSQLSDAGIDLPIVASNWTASDVDVLRRSLTRRRSPVFALTIWDVRSPDYERFRKIIWKRFGKEPTAEMACGFDVGTVLRQTLDLVRGPVTPARVLDRFHQTKCFKGTSAGELCFDRYGGFAKRKLSVVRYTRYGLVPLK